MNYVRMFKHNESIYEINIQSTFSFKKKKISRFCMLGNLLWKWHNYMNLITYKNSISNILLKEIILAFWMWVSATIIDYIVFNIGSTAIYGTVQRTYLYISWEPLRRTNTRTDVSSPFHLHWIALGQISHAQGNTSGHDEVPRQG